MGGLYEIECAKMSHQSLARACDSSMSQLALDTTHKTQPIKGAVLGGVTHSTPSPATVNT